MKHRKLVVFCVVVVLILLAFLVGRKIFGKKLFGDLSISDIRRITVQIPPSEEDRPMEELDKVVEALNDIVVYGLADSFETSQGQSVIYRVTFADGYQIAIGIVDSHISVDGLRYKARGSSCEKLQRLAREVCGE